MCPREGCAIKPVTRSNWSLTQRASRELRWNSGISVTPQGRELGVHLLGGGPLSGGGWECLLPCGLPGLRKSPQIDVDTGLWRPPEHKR